MIEEKSKHITDSGIEVKTVYTEHNTAKEMPGRFPFTRGVQEESRVVVSAALV